MSEQEDPTPQFSDFKLKLAESVSNLSGSVRSVREVPMGAKPLVSVAKQALDNDSAGSNQAEPAELVTHMDTVFYLVNQTLEGAPSFDSANTVPQVLPVAAIAQLGSAALLDSLKKCDLASLLAALAFEIALVPVVIEPDGSLATRVFRADENDASGNSLYVFSSAETLESFLGDDPERYFIIRPGAGVVDYLGRHLSDIDNVMFDPAGPWPVRVPAALFPLIVEASTVPETKSAASAPSAVNEPSGAVIGFNLNLDASWGVVNLSNEAQRDKQILRLINNQTRNLGDKAAGLRHEMRTWLTQAASQAARMGAHQLGFLLARTKHTAAALSATSYFHDFGPRVQGVPHLDGIAERLSRGGNPDEELACIDTGSNRVLRHVRMRRGDSRLAGGDVNLLVIDYWLSAPDEKHVAHVAFSTPHVDAKDAMLLLADNVVFNGNWITDTEKTAAVDAGLNEDPSVLIGGE